MHFEQRIAQLDIEEESLLIYCLDIDEESLLIYCLDIEEESLPRGRNKSGAVTELCGCPHPPTVIIIVVLLQVVVLIIAVVTIFSCPGQLNR